MPAGDGTGPMGLGPMTGRAAGYCAGYGVPGYMNPWGGRGWSRFGRGYFGRGGGRGRGWRNRFWATGVPGWAWFGASAPFVAGAPGVGVQPSGAAPGELEVLRQQAEYFESALEDIRSRIGELEKESRESK